MTHQKQHTALLLLSIVACAALLIANNALATKVSSSATAKSSKTQPIQPNKNISQNMSGKITKVNKTGFIIEINQRSSPKVAGQKYTVTTNKKTLYRKNGKVVKASDLLIVGNPVEITGAVDKTTFTIAATNVNTRSIKVAAPGIFGKISAITGSGFLLETTEKSTPNKTTNITGITLPKMYKVIIGDATIFEENGKTTTKSILAPGKMVGIVGSVDSVNLSITASKVSTQSIKTTAATKK